jgi:hypothetical protein
MIATIPPQGASLKCWRSGRDDKPGKSKKSRSAAGDGADNEKGLLAGGDGVGERGVRRFLGEVFFAGEEAEERAALLGDVIADGAAKHWILGLEGIEDCA